MADTKVNISPTSTHSETNSNLNLHLHHHEHKTFTIIGDAIWVFKTLKYLNVMLLIIPFAIASKLAEWSPLAIFLLNFISIMPLAKVLGLATEELSLRTNQTIGGLLNATFGNAVEMILSIVALSQGEEEVVKSSLLGSILSNLLLVLGFCLMLGGLKYKEQEFNTTGAQTSASLLGLSSIALIIPAAFAVSQKTKDDSKENLIIEENVLSVSRATAIFILIIYICYLFFQLKTHKHFYLDLEQTAEEAGADEEEEEPNISLTSAIAILIVATIVVAVCSEFLVGSIEKVTKTYPLSKTFVGLILLPIVGNAAEHVSAITFALKNKMNLAIGIAIGSSTQIAMLVTPLIVIIGWIIGEKMSLDFHVFQTVVLFMSIVMVNYLIQDGKSNWLEGTMLLATYLIVAVSFFYFE